MRRNSRMNLNNLDMVLAKKKIIKLEQEIFSLKQEYNLPHLQEQYIFNVNDVMPKSIEYNEN